MKKIMVYLFGLVLSCMLYSCKQEAGPVISGNLADAKNMKVHLYKKTPGKKDEVVLSKAIDENGDYKLQIPTALETGWYQLKVGAKGTDLILDGTEKNIVINGKIADFQKGKIDISGSQHTQDIYTIITQLNSRSLDVNDLPQALEKYDPIVGYVMGSMVYGNNASTVEVQKKIAERLTNKYGEVALTQSYNEKVEKLAMNHAREMAKEKIQPGMPAPEIALPNPNGKILKLSDYKGKLVLLDFWAAWCGPCRRNNPRLVKIYNKYKDQGFDIFSVSLDGSRSKAKNAQQEKLMKDRAKEKWVTAIEKDGLTWDGHVSDLKFWRSAAAAAYGVTAIPKTYLIDKEGKIIAVNPHSNLESLIKANL